MIDKKGDVQTLEDGTTLTCGGEYFDWPVWRRILGSLAKNPYGWYMMERARFSWRKVPGHPMGRDFYIETCKSIAHSRVKPVWWTLDHPVKGTVLEPVERSPLVIEETSMGVNELPGPQPWNGGDPAPSKSLMNRMAIQRGISQIEYAHASELRIPELDTIASLRFRMGEAYENYDRAIKERDAAQRQTDGLVSLHKASLLAPCEDTCVPTSIVRANGHTAVGYLHYRDCLHSLLGNAMAAADRERK